MTDQPRPNTLLQALRNPYLEGLRAVVAFALTYLLMLSALDTGSLLQYAIGILAFGLGVRSSVTVVKAIVKRLRGNNAHDKRK